MNVGGSVTAKDTATQGAAVRPFGRAAPQHGDRALKVYRLGTHRTVPPGETLARLMPLLPGMGITRIANITGLDLIGIPVVMVCRPNSRSVAVAQGKGLDLAAAKVSGVMEAIETFHAERVALPLRLATYAELCRSECVAEVPRLPFSVRGRFADDLPILWVAGRELMGGGTTWLPYECVHTDYTLPFPQGSLCFAANTNGLASGNHALEAISHGLAEVIERDAITLWKRRDDAARRSTVVDLDTVDDAACRALLDRLAAAGIDVMVWDATSDVGVATFYCLLVGQQTGFADPEYGSGCHPSRAIALSRALTEAAQARTTYIAGSRDDFVPELYAGSVRERRLRDCRALLASRASARAFRDVPSFEADDIAADVDWMLRQLVGAGMAQALVVDLTIAEYGLPVVRVVVPGLEGPDKGPGSDYVPGARARAIDAARS
ncbi:MAG TPA: YcaO-like family protein [Burkholderiales bacterium]|nr:YcaO-like family protein [Burkholderiales bacterium]